MRPIRGGLLYLPESSGNCQHPILDDLRSHCSPYVTVKLERYFVDIDEQMQIAIECFQHGEARFRNRKL